MKKSLLWSLLTLFALTIASCSENPDDAPDDPATEIPDNPGGDDEGGDENDNESDDENGNEGDNEGGSEGEEPSGGEDGAYEYIYVSNIVFEWYPLSGGTYPNYLLTFDAEPNNADAYFYWGISSAFRANSGYDDDDDEQAPASAPEAWLDALINSYNDMALSTDDDTRVRFEEKHAAELKKGSQTLTRVQNMINTEFTFVAAYVRENDDRTLTRLSEVYSSPLGKSGDTQFTDLFSTFGVSGSSLTATSVKWWTYGINSEYAVYYYFLDIVKSSDITGTISDYAESYFGELKKKEGYESELFKNNLTAGKEFTGLTPDTAYTVFAAFVDGGEIISPVQSKEFTTKAQ